MSERLFLLLMMIANLLVPTAIFTFATGFFPYKPFISGRASFETTAQAGRRDSAPFDKVIFMVVDALRSDFVYSNGSGFQFTQSLIRAGAAIPFTAHATSPTITMPRIKAITTGSIPSFLDVILNFAESDTSSSLMNQDTWLGQLKGLPAGNLVMYGDDTWLKLFPNFFLRADGTTSFFVSDFTEVDNNITRHIPWELKQTDWNGMVMHFLGLDHIGHKSGPRSPHMVPKQTQMDQIVKRIYESIDRDEHLKSALLVMCGDHGMNDAGNHGGSAEGETSPALVFISPKLKTISAGIESPLESLRSSFNYYSTVEQSDIAPTLAGLLGFPVPLNNLGVFIPELLGFWDEGLRGDDIPCGKPKISNMPTDARIRIMLRNSLQILDIARENFPADTFNVHESQADCERHRSDGKTLGCLWWKATSLTKGISRNERLEALIQFCKRAQDIMSSTASNYDVRRLYVGIILSVSAVAVGIGLVSIAPLTGKTAPLILAVLSLVYGLMMFASSYVEEEHHFWYWISSGWLTRLFFAQCNAVQDARNTNILVVILLFTIQRVVRVWNQTGQKHAGEFDLAKTFLPAHNFLLWVLVLVTYLNIVRNLSKRTIPWSSSKVSTAASVALGVAALGFKIIFTKADAPELLEGFDFSILRNMEKVSLIAQARTVFLGILVMVLLTGPPSLHLPTHLGRRPDELRRTMHDLLSLFLVTQSRLTNIPLFLLFELQLELLHNLRQADAELSLTSILIQYSSFFALGGSNGISSIDLSNAYNGIEGYNILAVGFLTFCGNWAGPLWWTSAAALLRSNSSSQTPGRRLTQHLSMLTVFNSSSVMFVMFACMALRTHLFVWTVFSPKFLYSMAWSMGQHLCIDIGYGCLLFYFEAWKQPN